MLPAPRIAPIAFGEIGEQNVGSFQNIVTELISMGLCCLMLKVYVQYFE